MTTEHLPECRYVVFQQQGQIPATVIPGRCICSALRSCEQRVRAEYDEYKAMLGGIEYGAERSWDYALDAAREAVNALAPTTVEFDGPLPVVHNVRITDALAAIDALKEKP